jgi:hypothetical protein
VIFNWVQRSVDGGDQRSYFSIINNYFKPGPATPKDQPIAWRLLKPESERNKNVVDHFGIAYVNGNFVEGNAKVTQDNWDGGVQPEVKAEAIQTALAQIRTNVPFAHAPLNIQSAREAYEYDLANAGATLPKRDPVDTRIVKMVRTGNATAKSMAKGWKDATDDATSRRLDLRPDQRFIRTVQGLSDARARTVRSGRVTSTRTWWRI